MQDLLFGILVECTGQLARQHIPVHHCLELCRLDLRCLHGDEVLGDAAMDFQRRRLPSERACNNDLLDQLPNDADKRLLGLRISVITEPWVAPGR
jgi:hypothetical protein